MHVGREREHGRAALHEGPNRIKVGRGIQLDHREVTRRGIGGDVVTSGSDDGPYLRTEDQIPRIDEDLTRPPGLTHRGRERAP